ncbi:MAG: 4Fe-4S binding protein [Chloroflexi bacterium]|nr:4Fe-4S binding protein [Chloroflexota bacterium]
MTQRNLLIDSELCVGCQACEIACKQEHNLPVGPRWIRVVQVGPRPAGGRLVMSFHPTRCMNCGKPPCVDACPEGAITKRADGNVLINEALCTGCMACIEACPFDAPQFNQETNTVGMCTLCAHRTDYGLMPACSLACPTGAIQFGEINSLIEKKRAERAARTLSRI